MSIYRAPSDYANGQTRDRQGRLVACSHHGRCLYRTEHDGRVTTLVERHNGLRLNAPNDVAVKSNGTIWFSDPLYGISTDYEGGRQTSEQPPALYRFDPATGATTIAAADFVGPNGLAFSPDERRLYVAETGDQSRDDPSQFIRVFDVGDNDTLSGGAIFHTITPGYCDGMTVDEDGNIWSSAGDGVHCISPKGICWARSRSPTGCRTSPSARSTATGSSSGVAYSLRDIPQPPRSAVSMSKAAAGLTIAAIRLACGDIARTTSFYRAAFGCLDAPTMSDNIGAALTLGDQRLEFVTGSRPARNLAISTSTAFQHCAIVVANMAAALDRLRTTPGWTAISVSGPERLPSSSGGVTAFKFRDPDGHPLELLQFPDDDIPDVWGSLDPGRCCLGVDHSAITVAETARSLVFYERLGFSIANRGLNHGPEQARLDGVANALVEVTALRPPGGAPPHLELLCYRRPGVTKDSADDGDTLATLTVVGGTDRDASAPAGDVPSARTHNPPSAQGDVVRDPDGHRLLFP